MAKDDDVLVKAGQWGRVVFARLEDGSVPALDFLDGLDARTQAQFDVRAERLAEHGRITNDEQFHKLGADGRPPIFEIKLTPGPGYRFYCFQNGREWLVTHGTTKHKRNSLYGPEIERAQRLAHTRGVGK